MDRVLTWESSQFALGLDLEGRRKGRFKDKLWSLWFELDGSIY